MRRMYYIARKILTKVGNATVTLGIYFIVLFTLYRNSFLIPLLTFSDFQTAFKVTVKMTSY